MNILLLLVCVFVFVLVTYIFKDFISPPVIMAISWIVPIVFVIVPEMINPDGYVFNEYSLIFVAGIIVFSMGFYLMNKKRARNDYTLDLNVYYKPTPFIYILLAIEIIIFLVFIKQVNNYVLSHYKYNYWFTYKWGIEQGGFKELAIMPFMRAASRVLVCTLFTSFLSSKKAKIFVPFFLQLIITVLYCVLGQGRSGLFALVIPLFIIYLIMNRKSLKKTIGNLIVLTAILMVIFVVYTYIKTPYKVTSENFLTNTIENYLGGSLVAYCNWSVEFNQLSYGTHTFRLLLKLLSILGFNVPVVSIVEEYVSNLHGNVGNVYTFYHWYVQDFGFIYSLIVQFFVGVFHGFLYKKVYEKRDYFHLILHSLFYFPLVMQFFMDEYTTILSLWIQCVLILYFLLKTNILFVKVSVKEDGK